MKSLTSNITKKKKFREIGFTKFWNNWKKLKFREIDFMKFRNHWKFNFREIDFTTDIWKSLKIEFSWNRVYNTYLEITILEITENWNFVNIEKKILKLFYFFQTFSFGQRCMDQLSKRHFWCQGTSSRILLVRNLP